MRKVTSSKMEERHEALQYNRNYKSGNIFSVLIFKFNNQSDVN